MNEIKLYFYNTPFNENGIDGYGCASLGIATEKNWYQPDEKVCIEFPVKLEGIVINDSLRNALTKIKYIDCKSAIKAGIIFFGNCGGENAFMKKLQSLLPGVPFTGGSPAIGQNGKTMRMLPEIKEVSVLLVTDNRYDYAVESFKVHKEHVCEFKVLTNEKRSLNTILSDGKRLNFADLIANEAIKKGVNVGITERFSVADKTGRNLHLISDGKAYECGADIPCDRKLYLRYTETKNVCECMKSFYACDNAIVFGCAGVKSLIGDFTFKTGKNTLGLFMFGEVVYIDEYSDFANLMLSRIRFIKK